MKTKLLGLLDQFAIYKKRFYDKVKEEGFNEKIAKYWWDKISGQASYSFALAHSYPYSKLSYLTMYLKAHYPKEFYLSLLNKTARAKEDKEGSSQIKNIIFSAKKDYKIEILPPDINKSQKDFEINDNSIRFSFNAIKNVGEASSDIISVRPYKNFEDFLIKTKDLRSINKRVIEALIFSGCFDEIDPDRNKILDFYTNNNKGGKQNTFLDKEFLEQVETKEKYDKLKLIQKEIEYLNFSFAEVPDSDECPVLSAIDKTQDNFKFTSYIESIKEKTSKKGNRYILLKLTDFNSTINVMLFKDVMEIFKAKSPKKGMLVKTSVNKSKEGEVYFVESIKIG